MNIKKYVTGRVLIVEDGPGNQRVVSHFLKKSGFEFDQAPNGQIACDKILKEGERYDCILMDMQMPVLDGYGAVTLLRENNYAGPIIALTAHAMKEDRQKCIDIGCDDYTAKPIKKKKLIAIVSKYVEESKRTEKVCE